jgi:hypothetical protein
MIFWDIFVPFKQYYWFNMKLTCRKFNENANRILKYLMISNIKLENINVFYILRCYKQTELWMLLEAYKVSHDMLKRLCWHNKSYISLEYILHMDREVREKNYNEIIQLYFNNEDEYKNFI